MTDGWVHESVVLDGVTVRYRERGTGPALVFVHGVYVGGTLWERLADRLPGMRCILPTWPVGAHADPAPTADLSARATARRIPAFLDALDLRDVTLVGNDSGGGLCLAALGTAHPGLERVGRLVLTNCDSYEHFPPKSFKPIIAICRRVPPAGRAILRGFATTRGQKVFMKSVCTEVLDAATARPIFESFATSAASRRDAVRTSASLEPSVTLDAVGALRAFDKPVLLAWGDRDKFFPVAHAERLQADFPNARLVVIPGAATYVMLDRPDELAAAITQFVNAPA